MIYAACAPVYDGPLDLLLQLAEHGRVNIAEISLSGLTTQYMNRVHEVSSHLDAAELADFLQLGARLTYLKSLSLLPATSAREEEEASIVQELTAEIASYHHYRVAARSLATRFKNSSSSRQVHLPPISSNTSIPIDPVLLAAVFHRVLKSLPPSLPTGSLTHIPTQKEVSQDIIRQLQQGPLALSTLIAEANDRFKAVLIFLAILELIKGGKTTIEPISETNDIKVCAYHA